MAGCMKMKEKFNCAAALLFLWFLSHLTAASRSLMEITDGQRLRVHAAQHFCYLNSISAPGWRESWTTIQIHVWSSTPLKVTVARDEDELEELEHLSVWSLVQNLIHQRTNETTVSVGLFHHKICFSVQPSDPDVSYSVKPSRQFDVYLFLLFSAGALLFFFADHLSRSQVFYYSAGMSTGMVASLVIVVFVLSRFLPRKGPVYVLLAGGWSFSVYIIQLVFKNLQVILREHWTLVLGYAAVVGFVSFAVCYRHGPLVEERSVRLLSWTLQIFGMLLMYAGVQVRHVALVVMAAAFCARNLDHALPGALWLHRSLGRRLGGGAGPRRLLTEEEFQKQAEVETQRALEELRRHCSSPDVNTWKMVSRLQSPKRFADFIEGSPHLLPNEASVHAQEFGLGAYEDDLFDTEEEEEEEDWETDDEKPKVSLSNNHTLKRE